MAITVGRCLYSFRAFRSNLTISLATQGLHFRKAFRFTGTNVWTHFRPRHLKSLTLARFTRFEIQPCSSSIIAISMAREKMWILDFEFVDSIVRYTILWAHLSWKTWGFPQTAALARKRVDHVSLWIRVGSPIKCTSSWSITISVNGSEALERDQENCYANLQMVHWSRPQVVYCSAYSHKRIKTRVFSKKTLSQFGGR